jgi:cobalt-zinc-cadmium efflux system membrane fusion protein
VRVKEMKNIKAVILVLLLIGVTGTALADEDNNKSSLGPVVEANSLSGKNIDITFTSLEHRVINEQIELNGVLSAIQEKVAKVGPVISGRISEVLVKRGDYVKAGQPLAKMVSVEIGQAVADYYKSIAEMELSETNYKRYKSLQSRNIGAKKDLLAAEAEFRIASTNLNSAEKVLHALGFNEKDVEKIRETHMVNVELFIRAPISGVITEKDAMIGQRIGDDSNLFTVMDISQLNVDAQVFEKDIHKIKIGQKTTVMVNAFPGSSFAGRIAYIGSEVDPETRTMLVRTRIKNKDSRLKVGMFARMLIDTGKVEPVACLPAKSILQEKGKSYVFRKHGGGFQLIPVTTGKRCNGRVEVVSGVRQSDEVVLKGNYSLYSMLKQKSGAGHAHTH